MVAGLCPTCSGWSSQSGSTGESAPPLKVKSVGPQSSPRAKGAKRLMLQALKVPVAYTMAARMMDWRGSVSGTLTVRAFWYSLMLVSSLLRVIEMRKGECNRCGGGC